VNNVWNATKMVGRALVDDNQRKVFDFTASVFGDFTNH
jgi:hypothetical protein